MIVLIDFWLFCKQGSWQKCVLVWEDKILILEISNFRSSWKCSKRYRWVDIRNSHIGRWNWWFWCSTVSVTLQKSGVENGEGTGWGRTLLWAWTNRLSFVLLEVFLTGVIQPSRKITSILCGLEKVQWLLEKPERVHIQHQKYENKSQCWQGTVKILRRKEQLLFGWPNVQTLKSPGKRMELCFCSSAGEKRMKGVTNGRDTGWWVNMWAAQKR